MILYHCSNMDIVKIDLSKSKVGKDFGCGFYLSADKEQALELAERKTEQLGEGIPRLNVYEICLNKVLLNISKKKIISVLAHEIIHTVDGCFNHDTKFINISNMLNKAENLEINVRDERENIEEALESVGKLSSLYKYEAYCTKCGAHLRYISKGNADIVKNPEMYRHGNCGGIVAVRRIVD